MNMGSIPISATIKRECDMEKIGGVDVRRYYMDDGDFLEFVNFDEIPEEYREEFSKWMYGQTMPVIEGYRHAVYSWDWERWYLLKTEGKPTYFD